MIEQRFTYKQHYNAPLTIGEAFDGNKKLTVQEMVELLNEQQAIINHLEKVYSENFAKRRLLEKDNLILRKENEQLRKELNDCEKFRYAVFKRLNDEIKLLKPTNIEQYEQIQKLQEENRELRQSVEYWQKKYEEGTETFPIN